MRLFLRLGPKLEPTIWSRDTGHIGIHRGWTDGRVNDVVAKTKISFIVGLHVVIVIVIAALHPQLT